MGVELYREPKLKNPVLICAWPGIGNIGIIAVDTLRGMLRAQGFGEIESWEFFYPQEILIKDGELKDLKFPGNRFYFRHHAEGDLIFFIGEEQSLEFGKRYASGKKAEEIANLILDVAEKFGCKRVYTSGAAAASIHHKERSRVAIAATEEELVKEMGRYGNVIPISEREGSSTLVGLSGILLGLAKNRDLEGICLMGEIPYYLAGSPFSYPKASKSILELLTEIFGLSIDLSQFDEMARRVEKEITGLFQQLQNSLKEAPPQIKEGLSKFLDYVINYQPAPESITEKDREEIMKHIEEFFKKGGKDGKGSF